MPNIAETSRLDAFSYLIQGAWTEDEFLLWVDSIQSEYYHLGYDEGYDAGRESALGA